MIDQSGLDEAAGEVIEQFGVGRPFAELAEVDWRADDPTAEMLLPDAIDHDAGRQRIVRAGDGVGEFQTAASLFESGRIFAGEGM